jgi:hypothetical protein
MLFLPIAIALMLSLLVEHGSCWGQFAYLDSGKRVQLSWSVNNTDSTVSFNFTVLTGGWVGLGFNSKGSMAGADIVVGWIKDGQTFFTVSGIQKHRNLPALVLLISSSSPNVISIQEVMQYSLRIPESTNFLLEPYLKNRTGTPLGNRRQWLM